MQKVFARPATLLETGFHFCPGCHHGIVHRLLCEMLERYNLQEKAVGVPGVGCGVFLYDYIAIDVCEAPHGRATAVATGIKRVQPDHFVFTYQGDGDLGAIGTAEVIHAANRGENFTVIFVNNSVYGMTGGQMAPTTLLGQYTTTSPAGRDSRNDGYPLHLAEMLAPLEGVAFAARVSLHTPAHVKKARRALQRAFETQLEKRGFSFMEFVSACPTNWHLTTLQSVEHIEQKMLSVFPLGIYKNTAAATVRKEGEPADALL
ncbi:MAG: thiamine pyrophosphate-dependent enzyme [Bacillota bacterium]